MARHFMAVCVVCLLCVDHLPCKQHFDIIPSDPMQPPDVLKRIHGDRLHTVESNVNSKKNCPQLPIDTLQQNSNNRRQPRDSRRYRTKPATETVQRLKRHVHKQIGNEAHNLPATDDVNEFTKRIFQHYGNGDTMNVAGFEKMLKHLGLYNLFDEPGEAEQKTTLTKNETHNQPSTNCISTGVFVAQIGGHQHAPKANQTIADSVKRDLTLRPADLSLVCPLLLYKLTAPTSNERLRCIEMHSIESLNTDSVAATAHHHRMYQSDVIIEDRTLVWVYASLSILGISLCGLLGVAVIPFMDKQYYHHILQFLVALAVGTLAGDALLHLLPHAMMAYPSDGDSSTDDYDSHLNMTLKGLVASVGIVFFFITERALTMIAEWRKCIEKKDKPSSRVRVKRDPPADVSTVSSVGAATVTGHLNSAGDELISAAIGEKLCKHKYSSYPYCYDEIAMDTKDDHHHHHHQHLHAGNKVNGNHKKVIADSRTADSESDTNETLLADVDGKLSNVVAEQTTIISTTPSPVLKAAGNPCLCGESTEKAESYTIILREHDATHHGHSHTHGHVHSPPSSLSAVAWMVVMGDGLHNFTDGMAIGAAFSNNIAGGFSTAIAVFCHELPHELGDFAVLLKAGMSARQAVYYNLLSSVLSFFGTILGIWVGDTPAASAWIFAAAAGMFVYIALVDMMPELTTSHLKDNFPVTHLLLQVFGIAVGIGIMLVIAVYEDDLKEIFTSRDGRLDGSHAHHQHDY